MEHVAPHMLSSSHVVFAHLRESCLRSLAKESLSKDIYPSSLLNLVQCDVIFNGLVYDSSVVHARISLGNVLFRIR